MNARQISRPRQYSGPAPMTAAATAGLRQRIAAAEPLEWWQVIEQQTAREVARLRRAGRL